uniref:UBX domain-containing protein 11 n=1 Tax=Salvator merianae TaxID=96440 RepID=A0A8D0B7W6_SALMN
MTSPLSSLGKTRKMPLQMQPSGKRSVPFKASIQDGVAPTDMELMTSMMQKIAALEQKVKNQAQAIQQKNKKIGELEVDIKVLQKSKEESPGLSRVKDLEAMCLQLKRQIWEMERFLNDYGLIWVGEGTETLEELELLKEEEDQPLRSLWKPGDAVVSERPIDLDLILENLKDLNALAGEGMSQIERTAGGARLRQLDSVPLTFYQNGIVMFNGPFRSYEEPSTQRCLRDLMDGYFPSELQRRYPEGVPFQVTDKRDVFFQERNLPESFPGVGQVTGHAKASGVKVTKEIPGPRLSLEQFLNKLPKLMIRDGQVIDIRGETRKTLQGLDGTQSHEVILVETPSLSAMKKRLEGERKKEASDPNISTLRVKSENGEKTYIIKMSFRETIGDLRQHLAKARGEEVEPYKILTTFPYRVYDDTSMTLEQCGLVPNACLRLQKKASATGS